MLAQLSYLPQFIMADLEDEFMVIYHITAIAWISNKVVCMYYISRIT